MLTKLAGIGELSATLLVAEVFRRQFSSRRQLAIYLGPAPTPYVQRRGSARSGDQQSRKQVGAHPARRDYLGLDASPTEKRTHRLVPDLLCEERRAEP